jgi:hypothetical protein
VGQFNGYSLRVAHTLGEHAWQTRDHTYELRSARRTSRSQRRAAQGSRMTAALPEPVRLAIERTGRAGFTMSCDRGTGRLLAVLAAAVPANGRVLELGTGTGVGTAWITHGLQGRADVEAVTVEIDATTAALAAQYSGPSGRHTASLQGNLLAATPRGACGIPVGTQPASRLLVDCDRHLRNTIPLRSSP